MGIKVNERKLNTLVIYELRFLHCFYNFLKFRDFPKLLLLKKSIKNKQNINHSQNRLAFFSLPLLIVLIAVTFSRIREKRPKVHLTKNRAP